MNRTSAADDAEAFLDAVSTKDPVVYGPRTGTAGAQNGKLAKEGGVLTPNTGNSDSGRKQCDVLLVESHAPLHNCYKQLAPGCSETAKELEERTSPPSSRGAS